jgi:hypothetical protein
MIPPGNRMLAAAMAGFFAVAGAGPASAAASGWIDCTGQMVTTKAGKAGDPAQTHEIYQIDDAAKALYKYSETRKTADPEPVTGFDDKTIAWAEKPDLGALDSSWHGQLDRASLALTQEYKEGPETTNWTEQCKATTAPELATAIVQPTPPPPPAGAAPAPADAKKAPAKPAPAKKPDAAAKTPG